MKAVKPVIVLVGPTSIGKSSVSLRLASEWNSEIISADSRQIYQEMNIGTDKPGPFERRKVRHHLIDIIRPDEMFSAGRFKVMADKAIDSIHQRGLIPIVVGGTGLYVRALLYGLWKGPEADWGLRDFLRKEEQAHGSGYLHGVLRGFDLESAEKIKRNDINKVIRAVEVYKLTGRPLSEFLRGHSFRDRPYDFILIGLRRIRSDLYSRIDRRVDEMVDHGLVNEVRGLVKKGYSEELASMKGLGYRQIVGFLKGKYDEIEAIRQLKRDTRRYAKRQITWFNKDPAIRWVDLTPSEGFLEVYTKVRSEVKIWEDVSYVKG